MEWNWMSSRNEMKRLIKQSTFFIGSLGRDLLSCLLAV